MNILTFDIEDWYNCDFISGELDWDKHEVRIYEGVERILEELERREQKGTFFCLGWIAEKHPEVIRAIYRNGHHLGCHSYQHELSSGFCREEFKKDTLKAKHLIEDVIGEEIKAFRAPGFSITKNNVWALRALVEMGFEYDCSIFPSSHDYGGMMSYGAGVPKRINVGDGLFIKEFPINIRKLLNKPVVFSGGGYFRLFPYSLIKRWGKTSDYMMTYFHPRDFDTGQPVMKGLPLIRRFKSYVGIKKAFCKFKMLLDDFVFCSVAEADKEIDWEKADVISLFDLEK